MALRIQMRTVESMRGKKVFALGLCFSTCIENKIKQYMANDRYLEDLVSISKGD